MADFCAQCTQLVMGVDADENDLTMGEQADDFQWEFKSWPQGCEGCGGGHMNEYGYPTYHGRYNIEEGDECIHKGKGEPYKVLAVLNSTTENWPVMVSYVNSKGEAYARPISYFAARMKPQNKAHWFAEIQYD
ncbi:hypothetical protein SHAb15599_00078 [Acinetobacter phage SH-Ab 15599]|nr:hypothetical protein SHAb15599_00078 [Acinetobacter phage SH-Ab 15599]